MKTFRLLTQQFEEWRRKDRESHSFSGSEKAPVPTTARAGAILEEQAVSNQPSASKHERKAQPLVIVVAIASLTSIFGYRFYNQPQLGVGTVAPETIQAPRDGRFEDAKTTEQRRKEIKTGVTPILKRDLQASSQVEQNLAAILDRIEQLRQDIGAFPFVEVSVLSLNSQKALRSMPEPNWQAILAAAQSSASFEGSDPVMKAAIASLKTYRQKVPQPEFETLITKISIARQRYAKATSVAVTHAQIELDPGAIAAFLDLSDRTWQNTKLELSQVSRRILTQGIPRGLPLNVLEETVKMHSSLSLTQQIQPAANQLLLMVLQPNLMVDREETQLRAEQAALAVEPVIIEVKKGDTIVEEGDVIAQEDFVVLDGCGLSRRGISWMGLGVSAILVAGATGIFCLVVKRVRRPIRRRDAFLLCLLTLSAPVMAALHPRYMSLPAIGLLVSSFYSPTLAATQVVLTGGLTTFAVGAVGWEYLLAGTASGLLAAYFAGRLRSRDELSLLGVGVGLTQGGTYFVVNLILTSSAGTLWSALLPGAIVYGLLGLAWSVVALGISPYLERLFDLVTPIRLVELSNPNCGLLKRLATEAPGTFQHTLFVASLAEAAARELHCNVELVRAGTLYHDIGKMHDPMGFIENQMGGPNKHDTINNPWISADIIKKHVTEGLVMARKYGLPKAIRDFIPEHQGKLLISYFYFQAKQRAEQEGKPPVSELDFRYDGPIPQSRETGIVMLADACEAALRSLKEATPEVALTTIHKIFKARWRDNQLVDSGIRYEELPIIAEIFVRVWQQVNHQRIAYPKAVLDSHNPGKLH
ncbi:hypothetical protein NIES593_03720 [Hydrococcus rivularis NIES-593]|uniref:HD/PDEase domain-containing protein n=1 Tax=Hydrococcus rivularis NIES-593 TaxID=1921803 RepID=A0A1U7HRG2_9CYAN|nr:HD family phosphohydrolase [Hydrococcus rivularis]OKH26190.1 hypothetical protein NIES593_03720 [Hydrococcus rivularis NIES-593]